MDKKKNGNVIYVSHGGGPLPILGDESHKKMVRFMEKLSRTMKKPDEILVISAHWEEKIPTLYSAEKQTLLYDYYGFPPESYKIEYPQRKRTQILYLPSRRTWLKAKSSHHLDSSRGLDHGVFIPSYAHVSRRGSHSRLPSYLSYGDWIRQRHIALGKALAPLLERNHSCHRFGIFIS